MPNLLIILDELKFAETLCNITEFVKKVSFFRRVELCCNVRKVEKLNENLQLQNFTLIITVIYYILQLWMFVKANY